jgi:hypothetical protein
VDALETKIAVLKLESDTRIQALNDEQFKGEKENLQKVLEFHKEIDKTQGKTLDAAKQEIAAESQKMAIVLAQAGKSKTQIDAEIASYTKAKTALAEYELAKEKTKEDTQSFDNQRQGIQNLQKAGQISPLEAERKINQLIKERLPLLKADAAAELSAAKETGNQDNIAQGNQDVRKLQEIVLSAKDIGNELGQGLNRDFTTFFETVGHGTATVAQSFQKLAASVIGSIEQILVKMLLLKITNAALNASGAAPDSFLGGLLAGIGGHAEGGLIKGPGGPKSDSIPARVSPGEFIVKADAVSLFGAHNLEAINRGLNPPSIANLPLPKFAEGGLIAGGGVGASDSNINLGIELSEGLILKHLSSKAAGNIILQHLSNNPKAAAHAIGRSQG